jgi:hypothetical protein
MSFGYPQLYGNGLNSTSQIRRSVDFIYQRGGEYEIVLTGSTLEPTMQMIVDLYSDDERVGNFSLVPYDTSLSGSTYYYKFNLRPYSYLMNYVNAQHYEYYWLNDWDTTSQTINIDNKYKNGIKANFKYGYRYLNATGGTVNEYTILPQNDLVHYTYLPDYVNPTGFTPSDYVSTGKYFDYIGGTFEFDNNFILPNFDQEVGTVIGTGFTKDTISLYNRLSPVCQFIMDYPTVPEMSETARFLTEAPRIQYIQEDESYTLYYLNGQTGDRQVIEADWLHIEFYDANNNLINTQIQELNKVGTPFQSPSGYTDTLQIFALPCGPVELTNLFTGVTFNNVAYYRVQLFYGLPTWNANRQATGPIGPVSEAFYFYLYDNCLPESTRLVWLNDRGGYDYYTFQSYRQDTKQVDRTNYDSRYYSTSLQSPDRNIGRTNKTFDTNVTQEIVLESNYLNIAAASWLEGLFLSPQVYLIKGDYISPIDRNNKIYKDLRPVLVTSTSVDTITKKHSKLNKYRITLKTSDTYFVNKGF